MAARMLERLAVHKNHITVTVIEKGDYANHRPTECEHDSVEHCSARAGVAAINSLPRAFPGETDDTEGCSHTHTQARGMIEDVRGRGLVEIVRANMLVSGPACKDYCYKNFIMCGDHRAQTSDKLVMWKAANKIDYCKEQQRICHSQC